MPGLRPSAALRLVPAALAAVLMTIPLTAQVPPGAAGRVVDARSEAPLAGAVVEVEGTGVSTRTDQTGRFRVHLPPGRYRAFVHHPEYLPTSEGWWVGAGTLAITVALEPNLVVLDPVSGTAHRGSPTIGERIAMADGDALEAPLVFGERELAESGAQSAADFVLSRLSLIRVPCPPRFFGEVYEKEECVRIRGTIRPVCVAIDGAALPGGLGVLASYHPRDLARVSAFRGGEFVMIHTKWYVHNAKWHGWRPVPVSAQIKAFCRR